MKTTAALLTLFAATAAVSMTAVAADAPPPGKKTFDRYCAECHAPGHGHPGTQQLEWTRGKQFSILEDRKDLIPAYVATIVRNGLYEMAPFRPSEINDAALNELVAYLAPPKKIASKKR
jgi:mono/diheme cytochrome c family protein